MPVVSIALLLNKHAADQGAEFPFADQGNAIASVAVAVLVAVAFVAALCALRVVEFAVEFVSVVVHPVGPAVDRAPHYARQTATLGVAETGLAAVDIGSLPECSTAAQIGIRYEFHSGEVSFAGSVDLVAAVWPGDSVVDHAFRCVGVTEIDVAEAAFAAGEAALFDAPAFAVAGTPGRQVPVVSEEGHQIGQQSQAQRPEFWARKSRIPRCFLDVCLPLVAGRSLEHPP